MRNDPNALQNFDQKALRQITKSLKTLGFDVESGQKGRPRDEKVGS
jgi:hypothetical protein